MDVAEGSAEVQIRHNVEHPRVTLCKLQWKVIASQLLACLNKMNKVRLKSEHQIKNLIQSTSPLNQMGNQNFWTNDQLDCPPKKPKLPQNKIGLRSKRTKAKYFEFWLSRRSEIRLIILMTCQMFSDDLPFCSSRAIWNNHTIWSDRRPFSIVFRACSRKEASHHWFLSHYVEKPEDALSNLSYVSRLVAEF